VHLVKKPGVNKLLWFYRESLDDFISHYYLFGIDMSSLSNGVKNEVEVDKAVLEWTM
jgi:hypothetical protein